MLAAKNILGVNYDLWAVNDDDEYGEEVSTADRTKLQEFRRINETQPHVPMTVAAGVSPFIWRDSH